MSEEALHSWIEKTLARIDTNTDHIAELIAARAEDRAVISELLAALSTQGHKIAALERAAGFRPAR